MAGTGVELARGFVSLGANTEQLGRDVGDAFGRTEREAEQSGARAGALFSKAMGPLVGVGAITAVGTAFFAIGSKFDDLADKIQTTTGESGDALNSLVDTAKNVSTQVPESLDTVGDAVSELRTKLGITGQPLEDLSTQFLNLSHITGVDVKASIDSAAGAFQRWGVHTADQGKELDFFYNVSTKTGTSITSLTDNLQKFGIPLQEMGFGLDESAALLGRLDKAGINTDQVMGSLRKGLATFAKAGEDPAKAMDRIMASIKNAPTDVAATGIALQAFGARGGTEMAAAIRQGKLSVDDLMASIDESHTTINQQAEDTADLSESWGKLKNRLMVDVEPAASWVFSKISDGMKWIDETGIPALKRLGDDVMPVLKDAANTVADAFTSLWHAAQSTWEFLERNKTTFEVIAGVLTTLLAPALIAQAAAWAGMGIAAAISGGETIAIWTLLQASAIRAAVVSMGAHITMAAGWVLTGTQATLNAIKIAAAWLIALGPVGIIIAAIALIVGAFVLLWNKCDWFRNFWKSVWEWIKDAALNVWEHFLKPFFDRFMDVIGWVIEKVVWLKDKFLMAFDLIGAAISFWWNNIVQPIWHGLGEAIQWVIHNVIEPAFESFKNALGKVGDFFGNVVDGIKNAWNEVKKAVAVPINFVIETVWNNGLLKAWNMVAGWLPGLKHADPMDPVKFATGGAARGGTPGVDSIPALLMPDEHVFDVNDVLALGGQSNVYALRHMLDLGIPFSWDAVNGLKSAPASVADSIASAPAGADMGGFLRAIGVPGYKDGGAPEPVPFWMQQLAEGHRFAQSKDGHAYTWGFEDCSGYMSMIADKILGGPGDRRWATSSFPGGQPWASGLGAGFSVFVNDDPGGPGGGHTAGTLSGVFDFPTVNVESGGAHGNVMYGKSAAGADSMPGARPGMFHLEIGADGAFVSGGGPSTGEQKGFLNRKLHDVFDQFLNPVKAMLPSPPPEMLGWPRSALQATEDAGIKAASDAISGLGHGLSSVVNSVTSVFRDTGGFIWPGMTIVRNETGQPEAVLNWEQLDKVKALQDSGKTLAEALHAINVQPMSEVLSKAGDTFASKMADALPNALYEMFTPSSKFPNPKDVINRYTIKPSDSPSSSTSSAPATNEEPVQASSSTPSVPAGTSAQQKGEVVSPSDYVGWTVKAAKDKSLGLNAAIIAVGTELVETGLKMYANSTVPESLKLPHDAVGSDHDSVGLFQQRASWGSVADRMNPYVSAGLFFNALTGIKGWEQMEKGAVAQAVQRSAFPDRYAEQMAKASGLLKDKFDTGGIVMPGLSLVDNQTGTYEHMGILTQDQWDNLSAVASGGGGNVDARTIYEKGSIVVADINGFHRAQKNLSIKKSMGNRGRPSQ